MHGKESLRTPHQTHKSKNIKSQAPIQQPRSEQQNRAWGTLKWFEGTAKTEAAFYSRLQELPDEDAMFLKCFYDITDDWDLFKMICKFWNVPIVSRRSSLAAGSPTA
jgi:hypothetical protein